jgi:hypothetical protein
MQVMVPRADLTGAADETVHVLMFFPDGASFPAGTLQSTWTIFWVNDNLVVRDKNSAAISTRLLDTNWRALSQTNLISYEANSRITTAFPDYSQRNANNEMNGYITLYGADSTQWPSAQQARKAEIDRCWNYVNAVRNTANAMGSASLPVDPSDNSHWPTVISPYVPL